MRAATMAGAGCRPAIPAAAHPEAEAVPAAWAEHGWSLGAAEVAALVAAVLSASALLSWLG